MYERKDTINKLNTLLLFVQFGTTTLDEVFELISLHATELKIFK